MLAKDIKSSTNASSDRPHSPSGPFQSTFLFFLGRPFLFPDVEHPLSLSLGRRVHLSPYAQRHSLQHSMVILSIYPSVCRSIYPSIHPAGQSSRSHERRDGPTEGPVTAHPLLLTLSEALPLLPRRCRLRLLRPQDDLLCSLHSAEPLVVISSFLRRAFLSGVVGWLPWLPQPRPPSPPWGLPPAPPLLLRYPYFSSQPASPASSPAAFRDGKHCSAGLSVSRDLGRKSIQDATTHSRNPLSRERSSLRSCIAASFMR